MSSKSGKTKIILSAILTLVILTASMYFIFTGDQDFKVDIQKTRTQYYVDNEGDWLLAATEYVYLYDGTTKMRAKSRELSWYNYSNYVYAIRTSTWKDNITTIQTYKFDKNEGRIENVPVENKFTCTNCDGKFIQFEIRDILYNGETEIINSPFRFGNNMNIEWDEDDDFSWAKVYQNSVASDKIIVKFRADSEYEEYFVRLYDPVDEYFVNESLVVDSAVTMCGNYTYWDVTVTDSGTINVCPYNGTAGTGEMRLIALNDFLVQNGGTINGDGDGWRGAAYVNDDHNGNNGEGTGYGRGGGYYLSSNYYACGGSGAGGWANGGFGGGGTGCSQVSGGSSYLSLGLDTAYKGSGGGSGGCAACGTSDYSGAGADGGSNIFLSGNTITLESGSIITSDGATSTGSACDSYAACGGGGGGSGGNIIIYGDDVTTQGSITSTGGAGGAGEYASDPDYCGQGGGGGSGGLIEIYYGTSWANSTLSSSYGGGGGGAHSDSSSCDGYNGGNGGTGSMTFEVIVPSSVSSLTSETNYTTENITATCDGSVQVGNMTFYWEIFKNGISYDSGKTDNVTGSTNVYNVTFDDMSHNNTWYLVCTTSNYTYNLSSATALNVTQPFIANITHPINDDDLYGRYQNFDYDYEIYSDNLSCTYSEDYGVTNISIECDAGTISDRLWDYGLNEVVLYANYYGLYDNYTFPYYVNFTTHDFPAINILYPENMSYITDVNEINYTVQSDVSDDCWYVLNGEMLNGSVSAGTNFTSVNSSIGQNNLKIWCNDTGGQTTYEEVSYYLDAIRYSPDSDATDTATTGIGTAYINVTVNPILDLKNITMFGYNLTDGVITEYITSYDCFQESFNVSNQTGQDGDCGLNYTGNMSFDDYYHIMFINYTKPENATTAKWKIKYGTDNTIYIPITDTCWAADSDNLELSIWQDFRSGASSFKPRCYNGTGWETIFLDGYWSATGSYSTTTDFGIFNDGDYDTHGIFTSPIRVPSAGDYTEFTFYEDAMIWNVPRNLTTVTFNSTSDPFYWDVLLYDSDEIAYTLPMRYNGNEVITFTINGGTSNLDMELETRYEVNITSNIYNVSMNIDTPEYPDNYSNSFLSSVFNMTISYMYKNIFSTGNTIYSMLFSSGTEPSNSSFNVPSHQYDEAQYLAVNISGGNYSGGYPDGLTFYKANSTDVDRKFYGYLIGDLVTQYQNKYGNYSTTLYYTDENKENVEFLLDDGAKFNKLIFYIVGDIFGKEYEDEFDDSSILDVSENEGMMGNSLGLPPGNNLQEFSFHSFYPTGGINDILFTAFPSGSYETDPAEPDDSFDFDITNTYSEDNLRLIIQADESVNDGNTESETIVNYAYPNWTYLNTWSAQSINFDLDFATDTYRVASERTCSTTPKVQLGGATVWSMPFTQCDDDLSSCDTQAYSHTGNDIHFNLTRIDAGYQVDITGLFTFTGDDIDDGECGTYTYVYNYTGGELRRTYQHSGEGGCGYTDGTDPLTNSFELTNVNWNTAQQLLFTGTLAMSYDDDDNEGCDDAMIDMAVKNLDVELYNISSGYLVSDTVFTTASAVSRADMGLAWANLNSSYDTASAWLSANGGQNWETVTTTSNSTYIFTFTYPGTDMRYKFYFDIAGEGYLTLFPFFSYMNITTPKGYPTDITFDFGNDGIIDANISGELNGTNSPQRIVIDSADISDSLYSQYDAFPHLAEVPLSIYSSTPGKIFLYEFNLTYDPNPVILDNTSVLSYLSNSSEETDIVINTSSINGNVTLDGLDYRYRGGNQTFNLTVKNSFGDIASSIFLNNFYSRWDYVFGPEGVYWLFFSPKYPTDKNVTPYGQEDSIPILNLTNYGYHDRNVTLSIYQNNSLACVNTTISTTPNKEDGELLIEDWVNISELDYLDVAQIYLWADYSCSYSTWRTFEPQYYFRQCVDGGLCDESLI